MAFLCVLRWDVNAAAVMRRDAALWFGGRSAVVEERMPLLSSHLDDPSAALRAAFVISRPTLFTCFHMLSHP